MNKHNLYFKCDELLTMEKGIFNEKILIFFKNEYFYVQESYTRCFKFSIRRAKNTFGIKNINQLFKLFIDNIENTNLEKKNENSFYLIVSFPLVGFKGLMSTQKIKLKEINNFLSILETDTYDIVIKKQNDKISSLLDKIEEFEKKFKEPSTDDELIITIK